MERWTSSPATALLFVAAATGMLVYRARRLGATDPSRAHGYQRIAVTIGTCISLLGLIWGIGASLDLLSFARPPGPPSVMNEPVRATWFDVLYLTTATAIFVRGSWWLYFRGGAAFLVEHNRFFGGMPHRPLDAKFTWGVLVLASVVSWAYQLVA